MNLPEPNNASANSAERRNTHNQIATAITHTVLASTSDMPTYLYSIKCLSPQRASPCNGRATVSHVIYM